MHSAQTFENQSETSHANLTDEEWSALEVLVSQAVLDESFQRLSEAVNTAEGSRKYHSNDDLIAEELWSLLAEERPESAAENGTAATSEKSAATPVDQGPEWGEFGSCLASNLPTYNTSTYPDEFKEEQTRKQSKSGRAASKVKPKRTRGPAKLTKEETRYNEAVLAMNTLPDMMEFSLNFSLGQEGSFLSVADPANLFERRLHRNLQAAGLPRLPFAYAFDINGEKRLHAHGVIQVPPGKERAVNEALRKAGGFVPGRSGSRQALFKRDTNRPPRGWQIYTVKARTGVKKLFARYGVSVVRTCNVSTSYRSLMRSL